MDNLIRRNPLLIEAAIPLHRSRQIPPNTYLLDLDAHRNNARAIIREASRYGVSNYFMSKQIARNPIICQAVINEGMRGVVAVESQEARSLHRYGVKIGHVGHLVQIPLCDTEYVMSMEPEVWTVYNYQNAMTVSKTAEKKGRVQNLLVQPAAKGDLMFDTMTGGIEEEKLTQEVKKIMQLPSVKVVGTTSFPCLMYDLGERKVRPISNFHSAVRAAEELRTKLGLEITQINVPGHSEASTMKIIAKNGGTHGEPGSGVSGGLPWQV
ncbi:MAG: alanine racemase, partial [Nitrososphaerales archaeon]